MKNQVQIIVVLVFIAFAKAVSAQPATEKEALKKKRQADIYLSEAQSYAESGNLVQAEALYRKAEALDGEELTAAYNRGVLYDNNEMEIRAGEQYRSARNIESEKANKHRLYHNLGNKYLEKKNYSAAVEAYKEALRNDPTDDETRYNLALAKQEEDKQGGGEGDDNKQQQEKQDQQQNQENQDQEKQDSEGGGEGDQENKNPEDKQGDDKKDQKGEQEQEQNPDDKQGDKPDEKQGPQQDKGDPKEPKKDKARAPVKGKMNQQQMMRLLKAMEEEEQRIQEKLMEKQEKGKRVKTEKDW